MLKRFHLGTIVLVLVIFSSLGFFSVAKAQEEITKNGLFSNIVFPQVPNVPKLPSLADYIPQIVGLLKEPALRVEDVFTAVPSDFSKEVLMPVSEMPERVLVLASMPLRRATNFVAIFINKVSLKALTSLSNQTALASNNIIGSWWNRVFGNNDTTIVSPYIAPASPTE